MILAVDTSGQTSAVAVVEPDGRLIFAELGTRPRAHAEELATMAERALAAAAPRLPDHVIAGRGPGSFTGLRVGLVFAEVFAWARGLPCAGICTLDVVARQSALTDGWAVLDARRREVFLARYAAGRRQDEPIALPRDEARTLIGDAAVVGDVELLSATDPRQHGVTVIDPAALASCAVAAVAGGATGGLAPDYVRRPDVTMTAANLPGNLPASTRGLR